MLQLTVVRERRSGRRSRFWVDGAGWRGRARTVRNVAGCQPEGGEVGRGRGRFLSSRIGAGDTGASAARHHARRSGLLVRGAPFPISRASVNPAAAGRAGLRVEAGLDAVFRGRGCLLCRQRPHCVDRRDRVRVRRSAAGLDGVTGSSRVRQIAVKACIHRGTAGRCSAADLSRVLRGSRGRQRAGELLAAPSSQILADARCRALVAR